MKVGARRREGTPENKRKACVAQGEPPGFIHPPKFVCVWGTVSGVRGALALFGAVLECPCGEVWGASSVVGRLYS